MCGICGYVGSSTPQEVIQAMSDTIRHRGPDDSGFYFERGQVALGMRRLSIIDVTGGKQPIFNENKTLVTVFNGEIYNFVQLRTNLEARGHHFITRTDTEIIVHGYEEYGLEIFQKLDGMFAIALWDLKRRHLILARDRIGIKPIYYTWINGEFVYASEIKAFTQFPGFHPELDLVALDGFLTYQYVPAPLTLFEGIRKLRPGHLLIVEPGKSNPIEQPFWEFRFKPQGEACSVSEWLEELELTLDAAVRSHLVSDVPLGAFLSGGVDSSTLVALMAQATSQPVKTFSVGFVAKEPKNELSYSQAVAKYLGTDHHELMVAPDMIHQLPNLIWHMDEPLGDPASLPTFYVSKLAKDCGVTVALSGEGADEMFAGYPKYAYDRYLEIYQKIPVVIRRTIPITFNLFSGFEREKRLLRKMANVTTSHQRALSWRQTGFSDYYRTRLLSREAKAEIANRAYPLLENCLSNMGRLTRIQKMLQVDTVSWLPDDLLMKVDRMSMAASLEARVPYLDNSVVRLAECMPDALKLRGQTTKYLLKTVARKLLPTSITDRAKHGFELPLSEWIRGDLGSYFTGLILDGPLQRTRLFNQAYIAELLTGNQQSKADHSTRIWMLGNLSLWLDRFGIKI